MESEEIKSRLAGALAELEEKDSHLFENNLSERCIAARLAMHLQYRFPEFAVDVEYNRLGAEPKTLDLPEDCANHRTKDGEVLVLPDIIVHRRGPEGPNILAIEVKKTTNSSSRSCDLKRIRAYRDQLGYRCATLIECETRAGRKPSAVINEWL